MNSCRFPDCTRPAVCGRWCEPHWHHIRLERETRRPACLVPGCTRRSHAGGMCGRHYMQAHNGKPFTEPCDGICGKPHPVWEPPDPPLPAGLADACTMILRMHMRRPITA